MNSYLYLFACLAASVAVHVQGDQRTLNVTLNPGCPETNCAFGVLPPFANNLVYVRSEVVNSTDAKQYHLIWTTIGAPTFIVAEVSPADPKDLDLAWLNFAENNRPNPPYLWLHGSRYAGIAFSKLIEYNDINNTGLISDANDTRLYHLEKDTVKWLNLSLAQEDGGGWLASFTAEIKQEGVQFNLTIQVRAHPGDGRSVQNPKMLFTPGSAVVRVILDQMPLHFPNSRFALEVMFASNDSSRVDAVHSQDKSMSDENSPGVFTVERVGGSDTYVQWRPIVYTKVNPGVSDSTRSHTGPLLHINSTVDFLNHTGWGMPYSLLAGIAGIQDRGASLLRFNVSFGITDDDFYNATGYQEWSCELGVGQPPIDVVSKNVKLIIAVGFGIPAVLIVLGGAYVAYLKYKKRRENRLTLITTETTSTNYQTLTS